MGEAAKCSERGKKPREILENDTVREEKETVRFRTSKGIADTVALKGMKFRKPLARRRGWRPEGEVSDINRIKHKSLILAQDERWRRA